MVSWLRRPSFKIIILIHLIFHFQCALAQSAAQCSTNSIWDVLENDLKDGPCVVMSQLGEACNNGNPQLAESLDPGTEYTQQPSPCYCTIEGYNLVSACAACQNPGSNQLSRKWVDVATWMSGCDVTSLDHFPSESLPPSVHIPQWASIPPNTTFDLNSTLALAAAEQEQAGTPGSFTPPSIASSSATASSTGNLSSPAAVSNKIHKAGIIAAGVIGGLVLVILGVILIYYCVKNRSRNNSLVASPFLVQAAAVPYMHQSEQTHGRYNMGADSANLTPILSVSRRSSMFSIKEVTPLASRIGEGSTVPTFPIRRSYSAGRTPTMSEMSPYRHIASPSPLIGSNNSSPVSFRVISPAPHRGTINLPSNRHQRALRPLLLASLHPIYEEPPPAYV